MRTFLFRKSTLLLSACLLLNIAFLSAQKNINAAEVEFEFISKGVDGKISGFESSSFIDQNDLTNSKFEGSVAVKTIRTGIFLRDWSLKGGKYFDEDAYPRIQFKSTSIEEQDGKLVVTGDLSLKGITKSITIRFTQSGNTLLGTTSLYSSDYGINIKKKREDNKVEVSFKFTLD
ncbi:MAG: YceI family protein [Flavobacteriaceae bacterium]